jgi:hypothetical protein
LIAGGLATLLVSRESTLPERKSILSSRKFWGTGFRGTGFVRASAVLDDLSLPKEFEAGEEGWDFCCWGVSEVTKGTMDE